MRLAVFLVLMFLLFNVIELGFAQLANSPWPMVGHDARRTGQSPYNVAGTAELKWKFKIGGWISSSPVIGTDGTVYLGSDGLYAISPGGSLKWKFNTEDRESYSSPAIGSDGTVYVGSVVHVGLEKGRLYAINPDGSLKWKFTTESWIFSSSSPAIGADGTVYIQSNDKYLYAINSDGSLKWKFMAGYSSSPAIGSDGTVYVVTYDDLLYAINPDGSLKWSFKVKWARIDSVPIIGSDGTVYVAADQLHAINPDGSLKWESILMGGVYSSPAIGSDGTVYVRTKYGMSNDPDTEYGDLVAINQYGWRWKFETNWRDEPGSPSSSSSPAISADGTIYVGFEDTYLYAIKPDGRLKWKFKTEGMVISSPAIGANGILYVGSDDGYLYAIGATNTPPTLNAGKVTPETGHDRMEFVFSVTYADSDDDGPSIVTVKIDNGVPKVMVKQDEWVQDYTKGVVYEYRTNLPSGKHSYAFDASDGLADATGDIIAHTNLTVAPYPYKDNPLANSPWPMRGHDERHTGLSPYKNTGSKLKWKFKTGSSVSSSPAIGSDGVIYVGSEDNNLYAINPDGSEKWRFATGERIWHSSPAISSDGTVYVGSEDAHLYAINPDGSMKWKFKITVGAADSSPAIGSDGTVYVGQLYAINPNGTLRWKFNGGAGSSSPVIGSDGTIYVGGDNLYAINPDGSLRWKLKAESWGYSSPAIGSDGTIYAEDDDNLCAINPDGTLKWKFKIGGGVFFFPAIGPDGAVYVGSYDTHLYAINPDGSLKWKFKAGDREIYTSPAIGSDGTVYLASHDTYLYAIKSDGSMDWKFKTGYNIYSSPAIGKDGTIYVGSDWYLYAIGAMNVPPTLNAGAVMPEEGHERMEFAFSVTYTDDNNDEPSSITVKIDDGVPEEMVKQNDWDEDYTKGVVYVYWTNLTLGKHKYVFAASDGMANATGDTTTHTGPTVVPYTYKGVPLADSPWPMRGHDERHTGLSPYRGIKSPELQWKFETGDIIFSSPVVGSEGTVYVKPNGPYLYAINPDGSVKWKFEMNWRSSSSPAIGSDGIVYVGDDISRLYAINPDGSMKWEFRTGDDVNSSPAIGKDGTVYVGSYDHYLYAINPDGSPRWRFKTGNWISSSPAVGLDGTVYIGSDHLYAVNPDGTLRWEFQTVYAIFSSPCIGSDGTVYVGSADDYLYAINPDGSLKWKFMTGDDTSSSPAIGRDGTVYVGSNDNHLYAINPDGGLKWKFMTGDDVYSSPAICSDGTVYVGSNDDHIYAINPDGTLKWKYKTWGDVYSSPAIGSDGTVYVGSHDNSIYALKGLPDSGIIANRPPLLSGGCVTPETGRSCTEFAFSVTYSDPDNDAPSGVMVKIDDYTPEAMSRAEGDNYIKGVSYIYKTDFIYKTGLAQEEHTYSFAASDGFSDAAGDTAVHTGPIVISNAPPILSDGSVTPHTGTEDTEFVFTVTCTDLDNDLPYYVTVKIDGDIKYMSPDWKDENYTDGKVYKYKTKLPVGEHMYAFAARDRSSDAIGDTGYYSGPIVTREPSAPTGGTPVIIPGDRKGVTDQQEDVSFTVSSDASYILDFTIAMRLGGDCTSSCDLFGGCSTTCRVNVKPTVKIPDRINILNGGFQYTYEEVAVPGTSLKRKVTISGKFISETRAEGEWEGEAPGDIRPGWAIIAGGSGTWVALLRRDLEISKPSNGAVVSNSPITIEGIAAGPEIAYAKINEKSVELVNGRFSSSLELKEGVNSVILRAYDKGGNTIGLHDIKVTLDTIPPIVTITQPADGTITSTPKIRLEGTINEPLIHKVDVSGSPVPVSEGRFVTMLALNRGPNSITVKAVDRAGNTGSARVSVIYGEVSWDINQDGMVDVSDLTFIGQHFGESPPKDIRADANGDGKVDILDLVLVGQHLGERTSPGTAAPPVYVASNPANIRLESKRSSSEHNSQILQVVIMAEPVSDVYGFQFDLTFPQQELEVLSVSEGDLLRKDNISTYWHQPLIDGQSGRIANIAATRVSTARGAAKGGVLASVTFRLKDTNFALSGCLTLENMRLVDSRGRYIPVLSKTLSLKDLIIPQRSELCQNYPNPFNPDTWIPYKLAESGRVTVRIYSVTGQLVRQLDLGYKDAGLYISKERAIYWDGQNEAGERVASGVYFYHLQTANFTAIKKLVTLE